MLSKLKSKWFTPRNFSEVGPVIFLLLISLFLSAMNYSPGTYLSGWDTLHPEFNFGLNLQRTIFGVFRVEQGLGAVAGHSHMADLPRIILLYFSHFLLPLDFLRYFYVFLNIIVGTLGMYFLLNKHFLKQKTAGFLGALFYLLNVGTVQTFNVPFEMFTTLFATLPFLFYFAASYLLEKENRTKNLFLFAIIALFTSPSAYAATLWYVLFLCFAVYFLILSVVNFKDDKKSLKHFFILISVFIAVNLFWLLPNIYFVLNHGSEVAKANINRLFSDQAFLKNKEFGNLKDILLLKSFYFDWNIYKGNGIFIDLLSPWINHFKDIKIISLGYLFGLSFIFGAIYSFKKLKLKSVPLFALLIISLFFLINDNFPISVLFNFVRDHIPFFKEALRFPDNKIFNIYVFLVSIFFGFATLFIIENIKKLNVKFPLKSKASESFFALIVSCLIIFYSFPAFTGNFINYYMRVQIPKSYFELFDYLKREPDSLKVANLPIQSPWGWAYYDWHDNKPSFQGAGFLYFSIKQPLLDRDFDRWSPYNESYYREMSYAIYKQDKNLLIDVINKYNIGFIFIDKSVTDPQNQKSILYFSESKKLIKSTGLVKDERIFGQIEVFSLNVNSDKIGTVNTNLNVFPATTTIYKDFAYSAYKDYITFIGNNDFSNVYYPFRDLIDNQSKLHKSLLSIDSEKITLTPFKAISNFSTENLTKNISLIPSDLIVQKTADSLTLSIYPNTPVFDQTPSSSSIKTVIDVSGKQKLSLSFNQKEFFNLDGIAQNTPVAAGKILLNNENNTISAFDTSLMTPVKDTLSAVNPFFSSCNGETAPVTGFTGNGIKITGKGDICILIPYKFLQAYAKNPSESMLTDLKFSLNSNAKITSCLLNLTDLNCIYYADTDKSDNLVSFSYVLSLDQIQNSAIKIFIKPQNNQENTYLLKDVSFSYSQSFADVKFSKNDIEKIFTNRTNLSFDKIYLSKNVVYDPGFDITKINNFQNDCASLASNAKKEIINEQGFKAIRYSSISQSYCDHFSYPNLPHNQGYLVSVNAKNNKGLPLTICISNYKTQKCDIYSDLSSFKTFDKDVFLLPPMADGGIGYNINFENIGINKSPSENLVSAIEFIPIPYEFLLNIKSESKNNNLNLFNNGRIEKITEYNPTAYLVTTNNSASIVKLNLSYEKGFKAYYVSCKNALSCFLKTNLAPFYAKEIKDHVLINNWANGWLVNHQPSTISHQQIVIVFLPQYFEYLGFMLLLLVIGVLGFRFIKKHRNKS